MSSTFEVDFGSIPLADGGDFDKFDVYVLTTAAFQVVWTGANAVDGVLKMQESLDGEVWFCAAKEATMTSATGARMWKFEKVCTRFMRVSVEKGSNTAGTVYCQAIGKP